ncbi:Ger(x)C family spore germination protein [Clostridium thailandense]|uniref:Ger(x)C family spore germination protein n=1 Tax=Clostridium thailandense TaxID=2794346 RepID=UPI003988C6B7
MKGVIKKKIERIIIVFIITTLSSTIFTGCWDQKIYERVGFILLLGLESSKEKHKKLLVTYANPAIGLGRKNQVELNVQEADLLRQAREIARTKASRPLEAGKIQEILISKELAEKGGIHDLLSIFSRDPLNPALADLVVVDGSPNELCEKSILFPDKPRVGIYIHQLLEAASKDSKIVESRIYNFDTQYYAEGLDTMMPIVKLETNSVKIVGSALFSRDKMVGNIDVKQTTLMVAMRDKINRAAEYICKVPNIEDAHSNTKSGIAFTIKDSKKKINVGIDNGKPNINIKLKFRGMIDEYIWDSMDKEEKYREVQSNITDELKNECINIIKYTQEVGSDPLGIGDIVRAKHNDYWKKVNWKEVYKTAQVNVDVKLEILNHGLIY